MLLQRGYSHLRYQDVSKASGVPVASLRHYFPTLERLRKDALKHMVREELTAMRTALDGVTDPWDRVHTFVVTTIDLEAQPRRDGWLRWLEYLRAAAHDPELATDAAEVSQAWQDLVQETLDAGVTVGAFHLDQTTAEAARELNAVLDGFGVGLVLEHTDQDALTAIAAVERAVRRMLGMPADR